MPTVEERLRQVASKVERAKEHVADLDRRVRRFFEPYPYRFGAKHDPDGTKTIYYVTRADPTPESLSLVAGDVIHNLVSALDHLAYQLVCSDTDDRPPNPEWIYFPIRNSANEYETKKRGKMEGASDDTLKAIDALKPYKEGNDGLWALYKLNNIDKHRLLIAVGAVVHSINIGAHTSWSIDQIRADLRVTMELPRDDYVEPVLDIFMRPTGMRFPLKVGDELYIDTLQGKANEKVEIRFTVALSEPQVMQTQPLLETLHQFTALVEVIVDALTPRLKAT